MTQIRVHELASELNVSTQQVLSFVEELGRKVRGPSTVIGVSIAAKVRGRFRSQRPGVNSPVVSVASLPVVDLGNRTSETAVDVAPPAIVTPVAGSLFLPPVAPPARQAPVRATGMFADPFALPAIAVGQAPPAARSQVAVATPRVVAAATKAGPAVPILPDEPDHEAAWAQRGIPAQDRETWVGAGLRLTEADLADRCRSADIAPAELSMKLSGRTTLQRLRDGEASTSVWARIREAEQQPRRAGTKLTGRFTLT